MREVQTRKITTIDVQAIIKRILVIVVLAVIILTVKPAIVIKTKRLLFDIVAYPIRVMNNTAGFFRSKAALRAENNSFKDKNMALMLELSRHESASRENSRLRDLLELKKKSPRKTIAAEVIGRIPSAWTTSVLLNKGDRHKIRKKMAVVGSKGLVGTVVEAGTFTSKVMLINDPNSRVGVVLSDSRQTGVLVGTSEGRLKVIYLDAESTVNFGEKVYTSGIGGALPKDIPIGTVEKVGNDIVGLYKFVIVKPYQDLNTLEEVLCID